MSTDEAYRAELAELLGVFADNVRRLRPGSQEALAHEADLHRTEVGKLERGIREPRLSTLLIIAATLDVTLDELVAGVPVPKQRKPGHAPRRSAPAGRVRRRAGGGER